MWLLVILQDHVCACKLWWGTVERQVSGEACVDTGCAAVPTLSHPHAHRRTHTVVARHTPHNAASGQAVEHTHNGARCSCSCFASMQATTCATSHAVRQPTPLTCAFLCVLLDPRGFLSPFWWAFWLLFFSFESIKGALSPANFACHICPPTKTPPSVLFEGVPWPAGSVFVGGRWCCQL